MKTLIVFYSRTNTTKIVAEAMEKELKCDMEEVFDTKSRSGPIGYLRSGKDAMKKSLTILKDVDLDASEYDLLIIGTPIWGWTMSTPIKTYINDHKDKFKKVAFFCTMGGSAGKTFEHMAKDSGKKPMAVLKLKTKEVKKDAYMDKVKGFLDKLR